MTTIGVDGSDTKVDVVDEMMATELIDIRLATVALYAPSAFRRSNTCTDGERPHEGST